ncbi:MAG: hypothetical protein ABW061_09385 [Polyangiaceae bacterium]
MTARGASGPAIALGAAAPHTLGLRVAYLTDVEGQWSKLASFAAHNPLVALDAADRLLVAPGARLVFGGDAIDRGPSAQRIVRTLLEAKRRQPEQVVLLAGNRDINKMRLVSELNGLPPASAPDRARSGGRAALLRWIFENTMGAPHAFAHRAAELASAGVAHDDEAVVRSFLQDLVPTGELTEYLCACRLVHREEHTLFVHGGVSSESLGYVPEAPQRFDTIEAWTAALNSFYVAQCAAFQDRRLEGYSALVAYQAPVPGTKLNQASVVYGRPTDELGNPVLPAPAVIAALRSAGIDRVVLGHTPSGDCPAVLRDGAGFELVLADNSHGRIESGSQVFLDEDPRILGASVLDNGEQVEVLTQLAQGGAASPLGQRDAEGRLVKARLRSGDYLVFRGFSGYRIEQSAVAESALPRPLQVPR